MEFAGFGAGASSFFRELGRHNERAWFEANKSRYEGEVLEPALALVEVLGPRLAALYPTLNFGSQRNGTGSVMRIHRDLRFSADKRPYKENLGLVFWLGAGKKLERPIFYFHLEAGRAFFYGGRHQLVGPTLERYREAVADETKGKALVRILGRLEKAGLPQYEEPAYKRVPAGFSPDHPRAELLRQAALGVGAELDAELLASPGLPDHCAGLARGMKPLMDWLGGLDA